VQGSRGTQSNDAMLSPASEGGEAQGQRIATADGGRRGTSKPGV
jgi:hypothetical protein